MITSFLALVAVNLVFGPLMLALGYLARRQGKDVRRIAKLTNASRRLMQIQLILCLVGYASLGWKYSGESFAQISGILMFMLLAVGVMQYFDLMNDLKNELDSSDQSPQEKTA